MTGNRQLNKTQKVFLSCDKCYEGNKRHLRTDNESHARGGFRPVRRFRKDLPDKVILKPRWWGQGDDEPKDEGSLSMWRLALKSFQAEGVSSTGSGVRSKLASLKYWKWPVWHMERETMLSWAKPRGVFSQLNAPACWPPAHKSAVGLTEDQGTHIFCLLYPMLLSYGGRCHWGRGTQGQKPKWPGVFDFMVLTINT